MRNQLRFSLVWAHACPRRARLSNDQFIWSSPDILCNPRLYFDITPYQDTLCISNLCNASNSCTVEVTSSQNERNRTSLPTMILTYQRWIWPVPQDAQRRCHSSSRRQSDTIGVHMECTCHTVLLWKYQCAQEHPSFYALTTFPPSISQHKQTHIRATKKDSDSNDDPTFSQTHFHSIKKLTHWVLSVLIIMVLTWILATSLFLYLLRW